MDEVSLMEQEASQQKARLEAIQAIITTMGWRWFIAEVNSELEGLQQRLQVAQGEQVVGHLQGMIAAFQQIVAFEDMVDSMLGSLEEGEDADV